MSSSTAETALTAASSVSGTPTTSTPSITTDNSSQTSPAGDGGIGNTSTPLYLFTFLATLLVLLAVSCAIVLRSFYLRRQMRRRYEEAIAAGLLTPAAMPGKRRRDFGEKPKLYDAALIPAHGEKWEYMIPVAAKVSSIPTPSPPIPKPLEPLTPFAIFKDMFAHSVRRILNPLHRRSRSSSSQPPETPSPPPEPEDPLDDASHVQVSVLVAMPHPHGLNLRDSVSFKGKGRMDSGYWDEEEEHIPDVVIGVSQVELRRDPEL